MGSVIMILSGLSLLVLLIGPSRALINTDWKTLNREVTLKYFSPDQYYFSQDPEEIWREMGANITCRAAEDGSSFSVTVPSNFHPELPVKMLTHGFASTVAGAGQCSAVEAWMERYSKAVGVVLVDWANLASFTGFGDWDNLVYDWSARNSIDVGEFVGKCLAQLSVQQNIKGENIHIVGHSLGSHLMGKVGRVFTAKHPNSELVGRLTGLDPVGPRFVDGPYVDAIPELAENIISKESAAFVDIIHTNGAFEPCVVCTECPARSSSWATWTSTLTGAAPSTAAPSARTPCRAGCAVTPGPSTTSSTASGSRNCSDPRRAPRWRTATTR